MLILISALLLWLGTNGWYLSPFFYVLYLLSLASALFLSPSVAFSFVLVLVAVLLPQINVLSPRLDAVSIFCLFLMIPFSYIISHMYLSLKEKEKKIIILESEGKQFDSPVEEMLDNKITKFVTDLRQPLSDIKQIAYYVPEMHSDSSVEEGRIRIIAASEEALQMVKTFEKESTGRTIVGTTN